MKKYELTSKSARFIVNFKLVTLHQIKALRDIPNHGVKAGDLGGWIQSEHNLSQDGDAWIGNDSKVIDDAIVTDDAVLTGNVVICNRAEICEQAAIDGRVKITGSIKICGQATIKNDSDTYTRLSGSVTLSEKSTILKFIKPGTDMMIFEEAEIVKSPHLGNRS